MRDIHAIRQRIAYNYTKNKDIFNILSFLCNVCGTFDSIGFKIILWLFSARVSKYPVHLKHLAVGRNRLTFVTRRILVVPTCIWGSILGESSALYSVKECQNLQVLLLSSR